MNGLTRHWFSPWIPLLISIAVITGITNSSHSNDDEIYGYLRWFLATTTAIFLGILISRTLINIKEEGISLDLFFSLDFLALYVSITCIAFMELTSQLQSTLWERIFIVSALLMLMALYRLISAYYRGSAFVERPDVLSGRRYIKSIAQSLPLQKHGVLCGSIKNGRTHQPLYISAEDRGVVIGPPGTGKTAFMVTQLLDRVERKGSFVCLDIKPELHQIMREKIIAQGYRVLVFNPTNKSDRYNLLDDLVGPTAIGELAYSLIPSTDGEGRAFDEGARDLLDGIISYLKHEKREVSLPALREFLAKFSSETELIATLSQCSDPDVKDTAFAIARSAKNARFMGSVFATLRSNLRFLRFEDIRDSIGTSDFSLSVFRDDQPVALFLQFEERHQETTQLLISVMVSHLFNYFIEHVDREPVLLMLDEIGNVPRIPGLVEKLNTIRSRKLPTWMYWQGIQQMQKYGKQANEGPNSIMAACDFHMALRLNDNDTARWFSERIGTVDRVSVSSTSGEHSSTTTSTKEEPILKVADLQSLPGGESVAVYRGRAWRNQATPYFERWPDMAN